MLEIERLTVVRSRSKYPRIVMKSPAPIIEAPITTARQAAHKV